MWVRSEYANELAVLSAWVALLIPWSVADHTQRGTVLGSEVENSIFFIRFPLVEFQFRSAAIIELDDEQFRATEPMESTYAGVQLVGDLFAVTPPNALLFYDGALLYASLLWTLGAIGFFVAFAFSLALYFREESVVEHLPLSPVKLMGILLGIGALGTAGATVIHYLERDTVGFPIPAGVVLIAILALVLLRTEEIDSPDTASEEGA